MKEIKQVVFTEEFQNRKADLVFTKVLTDNFTPCERGTYLKGMEEIIHLLKNTPAGEEEALLEGISDTIQLVKSSY